MVKNLPVNAVGTGDTRLFPGLRRPPGEGNGYPLQCSCLENPRDGEPGGLPSIGCSEIGNLTNGS